VHDRRHKSRGELLRDLADHVDELVDSRQHTERYYVWVGGHKDWRAHKTDHESLLDQLRDRADPTFRARGDMIPFGADRAFQSSPAADINAIGTLQMIALGARQLVVEMGGLPSGTEATLRALVGLAANLDHGPLADLVKAVNAWRSEALTRCGWQTSVVGVRCPECRAPSGVRGLRIRVDRESAMCVSCGTAWSAATMGILGRRIAEDQAQSATPPPLPPNGVASVV
jgi:hypothetical protein